MSAKRLLNHQGGKAIFKRIIFLILLSSRSFQVHADTNESPPSPEWEKLYSKHYDFVYDDTFRSFIQNISLWEKILQPLKGRAGISYLEIGVNQGRSAMWVLENILTDSSATLTGIDTFPKGTYFKKRYLFNLQLSGAAQKATTIEGNSQIELRKLPLGSFDIIYIDGDHRAKGVLTDAVLSFELLKDGGILILHNYVLFHGKIPEELNPQVAIDSFITAYRNSLEVIHHGPYIFLRKREDPCDNFSIPAVGCSSIGQYVYVWHWNGNNELLSYDTTEKIELSDQERDVVEKIIKSTKFGRISRVLDSKILRDRSFIDLNKKLQLDFTNIEIEQGN